MRATRVGWQWVRLIGALARTSVMPSERIEVRLPQESDRRRFVEMFCDDEFMVFSGGVLNHHAANERFDGMLARAEELPFAKQPVIELSTGTIVGYAGVDSFTFERQHRLEFGWRLVPEARGRGYATEATKFVLELAEKSFEGELLAMIDPRNAPSQKVARKVGFTFWKQAVVGGFLDNLYRMRVPQHRNP